MPFQHLHFILATRQTDVNLSLASFEMKGEAVRILGLSVAISLEVHSLLGSLHLQNISGIVTCRSTKALKKALERTAGSAAVSALYCQPTQSSESDEALPLVAPC